MFGQIWPAGTRGLRKGRTKKDRTHVKPSEPALTFGPESRSATCWFSWKVRFKFSSSKKFSNEISFVFKSTDLVFLIWSCMFSSVEKRIINRWSLEGQKLDQVFFIGAVRSKTKIFWVRWKLNSFLFMKWISLLDSFKLWKRGYPRLSLRGFYFQYLANVPIGISFGFMISWVFLGIFDHYY